MFPTIAGRLPRKRRRGPTLALGRTSWVFGTSYMYGKRICRESLLRTKKFIYARQTIIYHVMLNDSLSARISCAFPNPGIFEISPPPHHPTPTAALAHILTNRNHQPTCAGFSLGQDALFRPRLRTLSNHCCLWRRALAASGPAVVPPTLTFLSHSSTLGVSSVLTHLVRARGKRGGACCPGGRVGVGPRNGSVRTACSADNSWRVKKEKEKRKKSARAAADWLAFFSAKMLATGGPFCPLMPGGHRPFPPQNRQGSPPDPGSAKKM